MPDKAFYRVDITESERGWGSRTDESIYFEEKADAEKYSKDYNARHNTAPSAPDWYMMAEQPVGEILTKERIKELKKYPHRYTFHKKK